MKAKYLTVSICLPSEITEAEILERPEITYDCTISQGYTALLPNYVINNLPDHPIKVNLKEYCINENVQQRIAAISRSLFDWMHDNEMERLVFFIDPEAAKATKEIVRLLKKESYINVEYSDEIDTETIPCSLMKIVAIHVKDDDKIFIHLDHVRSTENAA